MDGAGGAKEKERGENELSKRRENGVAVKIDRFVSHHDVFTSIIVMWIV